MNRNAARILWIFLLAMLVFTLVSWKLDVLRTPWVSCVRIRGGSVDGISYDSVVPVGAVYGSGTSKYIYILETDTRSWFYPVAVRRKAVMVEAEDAVNAALQGKYPDAQVVKYADRPLSGSMVPVRVWEEDDGLLRNMEDQVELLGVSSEAEDILREAEKGWDVTWEDDRLVVRGADRFTAQEVLSMLKADYPDAVALDYSWSTAVLRQSGRLWMGAAAVAVIIMLCQTAWQGGKREFALFRKSLETQYWRDYLYGASVRLLAEMIVLTIGTFLMATLIRWLWNVPIELPGGFLPEGSIFQWEHYRQWFSNAFPKGRTSAYGAGLVENLKTGYGLAGAEWAAIAIVYIIWTKRKRRMWQHKNEIFKR